MLSYRHLSGSVVHSASSGTGKRERAMPSEPVRDFLKQMEAGIVDENLSVEIKKLSDTEVDEVATHLMDQENQKSPAPQSDDSAPESK
jgi:hypothetical protein